MDTYGGHIVVSELYGAMHPLTGERAKMQGRLSLDSVELTDLGQGEMEHAALFLQFAVWRTDSSDNPVQSVRRCSFRHMHNLVL